MTDLLAEVDDMMRRERVEKIWRDHGPKIVALLVTVILGTALYSAWNAWETHTKTRDTDTLLTLMETSAFPHNIDPQNLDMRGGTRGVTALIAARSLLIRKENDRALAVYESVSADRGIDPELRQLGTLMKVRLLSPKDGADMPALREELEDVYKDKASPWRHHARLEAAVLAAAAKDYKGAQDILGPLLKEEDLPETFIAKARALNHVYGLRAQKTVKINE
ncbi:MAG: hypothetical protein ACT4OY_07810 [Alphaproteobacteria bacterium]